MRTSFKKILLELLLRFRRKQVFIIFKRLWALVFVGSDSTRLNMHWETRNNRIRGWIILDYDIPLFALWLRQLPVRPCESYRRLTHGSESIQKQSLLFWSKRIRRLQEEGQVSQAQHTACRSRQVVEALAPVTAFGGPVKMSRLRFFWKTRHWHVEKMATRDYLCSDCVD